MRSEQPKEKNIALIIWNAEKKDDVRIYLGELHSESGEGQFVNKEKGWKVSLTEEQMARIRRVDDDLKEMLLGADYAISLTIGDLPEANAKDFVATGMKWI